MITRFDADEVFKTSKKLASNLFNTFKATIRFSLLKKEMAGRGQFNLLLYSISGVTACTSVLHIPRPRIETALVSGI